LVSLVVLPLTVLTANDSMNLVMKNGMLSDKRQRNVLIWFVTIISFVIRTFMTIDIIRYQTLYEDTARLVCELHEVASHLLSEI
jgi:hypothetical protein